jgi:short-subunit dehydrogenase
MKVLVIGATSGLGAALALNYLRRGHSVVATGRHIDRVAEIFSFSNKVTLVQNDVVEVKAVQELVGQCADVDIIYYCAAIIDPAPIDLMMRVNFEAMTLIACNMDRSGRTIVVIFSLAAVVPFENIPNYCATKAALEYWIAARKETLTSNLVIARPGKFASGLFQKTEKLDVNSLPIEIAKRIVLSVERGQTSIYLGGWRDRLCARLAPVIGGSRARKLLL